MIDLSFDELRLLAQIRNINDSEKKSKEDLIKALSEIKQEKLKQETSKQEKLKAEKTKPEIRVNKKKLKKLRKDFDELRHKFSKKEIDRYKKAFYVAKNKQYLSKSEKKNTNKSFNKLKKSLRFKNLPGIDSVDYTELDSYDYNYDFVDDVEYRKIESIRKLFKELDRDYQKPIKTDSGFAGRNDNYIEYTSKADRYENLSPKEYLNVIRPYLRDLIDEHKPIMKLK